MDPRLTRRLIALELADINVPPPVDVTAEFVSLFFRVLTSGEGAVRVELWQLGESFGARSVSLQGSPQLAARRIALAAAELARQLRHRRVVAAKKKQPTTMADEDVARGQGVPIHGRLALSSSAQAAFVGLGDAWLVGPTLGLELRFSNGPRVSLEGAWLGGDLDELSGSRGLQWREGALRASSALSLGPGLLLDLGLGVAAAALHHAGDVRVEPDASTKDTWSARAVAHARFEPRLGDALWLRIGGEAGAVLRRWEVVSASSGEPVRPGGLWLGGSLGVVFDSAAR